MDNKPNVIVAGFPKCGSTYLYHLLKQHPDIHIPKIKELNYFNRDHFFISDPDILNPRYFKPLRWYYSFFNSNKKIKIDFSILSALDVATAHKIRRSLGDIKIVFIIRNKADFENSMRKFIEKEGGDPEIYKEYMDFNFYINNYKKNFSRVYVTSLEKINKSPDAELNRIVSFLGLGKYKFNLNMPKHETDEYNMGFLQYLKRHSYFFLVRTFYKFISINVTAKLKARGER